MSIILSLIEYLFMIIIYHIVFITISKNLKKQIAKSFLIAMILTISFILFHKNGVLTLAISILMTALMTSVIYNKNIVSNFIQVIASYLFVSIVELLFMLATVFIFGDIHVPEYIYMIILVILMITIVTVLYKIFKNKKYCFDKTMEKYNSILLACINITIFFMLIKILFQNDLINTNQIIELAILFLSMIAINIYYFVDVYRKNSNRKRLELKQSINPLIQELIDEMKANEHEYKNHLNILYCMIQVCKEDELRDRAKKYIGDVFENKSLVNALSDVENTILKAVLLSKINQAEKKQVYIEYEIEDNLENLPLDDSELTVVLSNLLNNAIEASSESNKKEVMIFTRKLDSKYIINVSNSVNNMDIETMNKIQKIGFSTKGKGRGYGLYNINNIVKKYKGKIEIAVKEDTFSILIEI